MSQPPAPFLAVVVPMLNEVGGAESCVSAILRQMATLDCALIIVDDGSTDGTGELLDRLSAISPFRVVHHKSRQGYGSALLSGASAAAALGAEWVLFMDSDLTNPPSDIPRFVHTASASTDIIKATRYVRGGATVGVPLRRRMVSRIANLIACRFFALPLTDATNGFRAIRVATMLAMDLHEHGFAIILEELYHASRLGLRCCELPTVLTSRGAAVNRSSFRYTPKVFYAYGRYPAMAAFSRLRSSVLRTNRRQAGATRP